MRFGKRDLAMDEHGECSKCGKLDWWGCYRCCIVFCHTCQSILCDHEPKDDLNEKRPS